MIEIPTPGTVFDVVKEQLETWNARVTVETCRPGDLSLVIAEQNDSKWISLSPEVQDDSCRWSFRQKRLPSGRIYVCGKFPFVIDNSTDGQNQRLKQQAERFAKRLSETTRVLSIKLAIEIDEGVSRNAPWCH